MLAALLRILAALLGLVRRPSADERAARAEERLRQERDARERQRQIAEETARRWSELDERSKKPRPKPGDDLFGGA